VPVMNGGKAVVEAIRAHGVTHSFCVPGESFLAVMDAFYDYDDVKLTATRHEGGAVFMAEGWAKASGRVGVAMATRGVGGSNLAIGVHTAFQDSTPLVVLVGQVPTRWKYREAFQEVDHDRFFGAIAKQAITIDRTDRIPELMQQAFRVAQSGRPGPVVVALPEDVTGSAADLTLPARPTVAPKARPEPEAVQAAVDRLLEAGRPVIIAGGGVLRAGACGELRALAEATGAPVYAAWRRFDVFPNDHLLFAGSLGPGMAKDLTEPLRQADLVLAIGTRFDEQTTQGYTLPSPGTDVIQIDSDPAVVGAVVQPVLGMVSDARQALQDLVAEVHRRGFAQSATCQERFKAAGVHHAAYRRISTPRPFTDTAPVDPEGAIHTLQALLPPETAIVTDAGNFSGWAMRYYQYRLPGTHFGPTSGAMGYGLPAAIGVKLATPQRPVVCLAGDGGFMMTLVELETAVRAGVPVVCVVFNNQMYGTIRMHQEKRFPGRQIATDLTNPSFAALGREFGCYGERVERNADLPGALERALRADRPAVIELVTRAERLSAAQS
jgi:acetolactate synthase I/II/III large subunit